MVVGFPFLPAHLAGFQGFVKALLKGKPFTRWELDQARQELRMYRQDPPTRLVPLDTWELAWLRASLVDVLRLESIVPDARTHVRLEHLLAKFADPAADAADADRRDMAYRGGTARKPELLRGPADDSCLHRIDVAIPEDREY
jgi:hypothetical protein